MATVVLKTTGPERVGVRHLRFPPESEIRSVPVAQWIERKFPKL